MQQGMGGMQATPQLIGPGPTQPQLIGPGPTQPWPNPTGAIRIVFTPSTLQIPPNQFVSAEVAIEGGPEGVSGQVALQFDPKTLRFTSIVPGPGVEIVSSPGTGQDAGRIVLKLNPGPGSRRLVGVTFQGGGSGQSAIAVSAVRLLNSQGADIPVQSGVLTIDILPPRASWQPGTTELPGWGLKI